jgi:hypothetical protein
MAMERERERGRERERDYTTHIGGYSQVRKGGGAIRLQDVMHAA